LITLSAFAVASALACSSSSTDDGGNGFDTPDTGTSSNDSGGGFGSGSRSGSGGSSGAFGAGDSAALGTGTCQTGMYAGTFSCLYYQGVDAGIGGAPDSGGIGPITGTMQFALTQQVSSTGELTQTDIASGTFAAATGGFIAADANLGGTLDCSTGQFTGQLTNGVYGLSFNPSTPPLPDPNNHFQGPLVSEYDGKTSAFVNGQWSMAIAGLGACIGTWTATYSGPIDAGPADAGGQ
jgi:hypothetical protein